MRISEHSIIYILSVKLDTDRGGHYQHRRLSGDYLLQGRLQDAELGSDQSWTGLVLLIEKSPPGYLFGSSFLLVFTVNA